MKLARAAHRPTTFNAEIAAAVCAEIAEGSSLRKICLRPEMPGLSTVFQWLAKHGEFAEQYARAREAQADALADEIIDIADNSDADHNDRRVRIDTRKWLAGKLRPKKYGDSVKVSGDAESPLAVMVEAGKTLDAKLDRLIARKAGADQSEPDGC